MTTDTALYPHPVTGEAIEFDAWLSAMADTLGEADSDIEEAATQLARMKGNRDDLEAMVLDHIDRGQGATGMRYRIAVTGPAARPRQFVDKVKAARYREQYAAAGWEPLWIPPTVAWHREHEVKLIGAGVPINEVIPDPGTGSPHVVTERIGGDA